MIEGISCDEPLILINLRVNVKGKSEYLCVHVRKDMIDLPHTHEGDGCMCEIFPCKSAFFFAKSIRVIPRQTCLAVGYALNEVLS